MSAGFIYVLTQLAKMLFLATFFPVAMDEEDNEELNADLPFDFLTVNISVQAKKCIKCTSLLCYRNFCSSPSIFGG